MGDDRRRAQLLDELVRLGQRWARGRDFDSERLAEAQGALLADTHERLLPASPVYARVAREAGLAGAGALGGVTAAKVPDLLASHTLLTDAVFKSYDPAWLDRSEYQAMTSWLGSISRLPDGTAEAVRDVVDLDDWLGALHAVDVRAVASSGTSGTLSFVPRDGRTWRAVRRVNTAVLGPLLLGPQFADAGVGSRTGRVAARAAAATLPAYTFSALAGRVRPRRTVVFLLDFAAGASGNQWLGQEAAETFDETHALYPGRLSAEALRGLTRGPRSWQQVGALRKLREDLGGSAEGLLAGSTVDDDPHLRRLVGTLRGVAATGRRVFIFGTPYQLLRLVRAVAASGRPVVAPAGSAVLCGGGWKTFAGDAVPRDVLVAMVREQIGVPDLLEAYSMIESNTAMVRCPAGRFHVPPLVRPYVVDGELRPLTGESQRPVRGRLALLDPLARAYPGFIATGDEVTLHADGCRCGLAGPAVSDIGRATRQEVKGCAGIAASVPV